MLKTNNRLFCFSPPVMIATFLIEAALLIYTIWRYKLNKISRLAVLILTNLAIFQLAEFMVCGGLGLQGVEWARLGFVSITLLPPLGLHLGAVIARQSRPLLITAAYASAAVFSSIFLFTKDAMIGEQCQPNYVVFNLQDWLTHLFVIYYYGWLIVSVWLISRWAQRSKYKKQLRNLMFGYMAFIVPTTTANLLNPDTISGIPSIMCGFAVIFAVVLVVGVLPGAAKKR